MAAIKVDVKTEIMRRIKTLDKEETILKTQAQNLLTLSMQKNLDAEATAVKRRQYETLLAALTVPADTLMDTVDSLVTS